jgi:diguanylate cyclase (GGDEF)-like protein
MNLRAFLSTDSPGLPRLPVALGLWADEAPHPSPIHRLRLRHVSAMWPFAIGAQLLASLVVVSVAMSLGERRLVTKAGIDAFVLAAMSLGIAITVGRDMARRFAPHLRNRALLLFSVGVAMPLLSLLWLATALPPGAVRLAGFIAVAGAMSITAAALHSVRPATLGIGAGLAASVGVETGELLPTGIAILFLLCLIVSTVRMALLDAHGDRRRAEEIDEGRLATKMVAEFEGQGTGWFWEADRDGRLTYLSSKVARELVAHGRPPIGRLLTDLFRMDSATPGTERTLGFHISSRTSFSDYSVCAADDPAAERWWSISGRPVVDELGRFQGFIGSGTDLTERRRSEAEITRLALFDSLTGLANRQRMRLSLDKTLQHQGGQRRPAALFLMDLDRFKAVNDTLGHQAGDALLKQVAQRLERGVGAAGLVGRIGGDEFQVLLPGIDSRETLSALARELIAALSQPYFIAGSSISIGCSVGIALSPQHGEQAEELIRNADLALYAAKDDGRGVHRFYSDEMLAGAQSRKQLEDDIRTALNEGAFHLVYQPIVSIADTRIVGYEALLRWDHPTRGAVSPAEFVPVAEESGLIEALGTWVMRTAAAEAGRWPDHIRVAVNVSPIQFANPALPALVTSAIANAGLPPGRLELEITEGVFLDESYSSDQMFKALKTIGVRLALDDFGTGYSSLGYLRNAPFDKIKIDQSFVRGAAQPGNRNAAIIKAIVTLADTLGMETTAEGVEVQDEIDLVRSLGCSHIQGYVYGRGVRADEVMRQLNGARPVVASGHKVSRSPRTKMLRTARIAIGSYHGDVRIRDISATGAMIDGVVLGAEAVGGEVRIELLEDRMFLARIAWARDGKVGLKFAERFNLDHLTQSLLARNSRRNG